MGTDKDVYAFPDKPTYYKDEECLTSENGRKILEIMGFRFGGAVEYYRYNPHREGVRIPVGWSSNENCTNLFDEKGHVRIRFEGNNIVIIK